MKLTLKLTDEVRAWGPGRLSDDTRTEVIVDVEEVQFTRRLMGAFFRALADDIDPQGPLAEIAGMTRLTETA